MTDRAEIERRIASVPHWYHRIEVAQACLVAMVQEAVFDVWHDALHGSRGIVGATRSDDEDRVRWRDSDAGLLR